MDIYPGDITEETNPDGQTFREMEVNTEGGRHVATIQAAVGDDGMADMASVVVLDIHAVDGESAAEIDNDVKNNAEIRNALETFDPDDATDGW